MHRDLKKRGVKLADPNIRSETLSDIQILIGVDYFDKVVTTIRRIGSYSALVTPAGIAPYGQTHVKSSSQDFVNSTSQVHCSRLVVDTTPQLSRIDVDYDESLAKLNYSVEQLWSLDTIGIKSEQYTTNEQATVER